VPPGKTFAGTWRSRIGEGTSGELDVRLGNEPPEITACVSRQCVEGTLKQISGLHRIAARADL
jgi:hypothetical protein